VDRRCQASTDRRVRLFIFQQISGINVPFYYGPTLLGKYFASGKSTAVSMVRPALR